MTSLFFFKMGGRGGFYIGRYCPLNVLRTFPQHSTNLVAKRKRWLLLIPNVSQSQGSNYSCHTFRKILSAQYLEILTISCQLEYLLRSWPTLTLLYSSRWLGGGSQSSISKLFFVLLYYVLFFFSFSFLFSDILNCYIIGKNNNKNSFTYAKQCILNIEMFF